MEKVAFAKLIANIQRLICTRQALDADDIIGIENLVSNNTPQIAAVSVDKMLDDIKNNRKIDAIKQYQAMTGLGLKESKDAVERVMD